MQFTPGEINILCSDQAASLRFYVDVLGFVDTLDAEGFHHLLAGDRQYLLLPIAAPRESIPAYGSVVEFSMDLFVADLKAAYDYLAEQGVTFAKPWQEGANMFVIRDPDGLPWEIIG